MASQTGRIVREVHDEPHVAGRRVTVRTIQARVERRGESPREVADELGLDVADVYRALAYYHENPEEMRAVERRREQAVEERRSDAIIGTEDVE